MRISKNKLFVIVMLGYLLSSCASANISYLGDKYSPTSSVDVYYSTHDITKRYKVIGHLTCMNAGNEKAKLALTGYAKKIGADAIILLGPNDNSPGVGAEALLYDK